MSGLARNTNPRLRDCQWPPVAAFPSLYMQDVKSDGLASVP
jgi:hypothetical protein